MKPLLHLSALLAVAALLLAAPAMAQRGQTLRVVPSMPIQWGETVPVIGGYPVMPGSVECFGVAPVPYVPSFDRVTEIRYRTIQALTFDLQDGTLDAPIGKDAAIHLLGFIPAPRFYDKPLYGRYTCPGGVACVICAQGISAFDGPKIAADDIRRTERLVCYESVNWFLSVIQRRDLWDSAYTQRIEDAVGAQVTGGWRTQ